MAIIRFATNVPQLLHLRTLAGKPVDSQFGGVQHMFTAEEGTFYVSDKVGPILMDQFRKLGVQPGDPIEITKAEVGRGPERRTQWLVATEAQEVPAGAPVATGVLVVPKLPEPPSELEKQLKASIKMVEARKAAAQAQTAAPAEMPRWAQALDMQTRHLVDVYAGLVNYAGSKHGNAVRPDDIRSMMTTVFINLSKGANSNAA
jgi:hypothetical protein